MNKLLWTIVMVALIAACSRPSVEVQAVQDAAEAIGGITRVQQLKTLSIEGNAVASNLGQNRMPDDELPTWKVSDFRRTIDLPNARMRMTQVRTVQFLFAGATVQRLDQGVDGDVGYNISEDGMPSRIAESAARDRRAEIFQHPVTA